ncbi:glycosyltransferase family 2 protein [Mangrovimonas futianensis]|uniref:glycosyltransferase family 2 protein n=1 Tax=Mangrovimonas futianensis TaxID=2895523 RepID=UPI001E363443|nr:glycosyltransferase family 2 protein [Mangrovimonas futianensis]MCF1421324.1 glycosyltransferase family 2 protein [Mangrovimonas futianensis]
MKLSVVILNYNVRYFLELCLKSVESAIRHMDAEIIVVDNQSSDESCEMVKKLFPNVKLIENKENVGFSKGNNIGVEQAQGEFICILNPDTVVAEDTFEKLLSFSDSKENLGIVGCRLIDGKGKFLPESKRNTPKPFVALKKMIGKSNAYYANQLEETQQGVVPILVGAFMFLKREVYQDIGGFDEDYFMYGEDVDISYKAIKKGYQNFYFGDTTVIHFKGESTLKNLHYAKRFYGAMQIFYQKHFKKNPLFNAVVWLGIKLAFLMRREPKEEKKQVERYVLFSDKIPSDLRQKLNKPLKLLEDIGNLQEEDEVVFDTDFLTFKEIIGFLLEWRESKSLTFKFLMQKSHYLVGSNSSKNRGELIYLKNND